MISSYSMADNSNVLAVISQGTWFTLMLCDDRL